MTEKYLARNLQSIITGALPVYLADSNAPRELPCIVVETQKAEPSFSGTNTNYRLGGAVHVLYNGFDDVSSSLADASADSIATKLTNCESLLNAPITGVDSRPSKSCGVDRLLLRGIDRTNEDASTLVSINFDAWTFLTR